MRQVPAPPRNLVLRDLVSEGEVTLKVIQSNQGEPFRETLVFSFERNASGNYEHYQHLASVELEPDEESQLRDLLNARAKGRTR